MKTNTPLFGGGDGHIGIDFFLVTERYRPDKIGMFIYSDTDPIGHILELPWTTLKGSVEVHRDIMNDGNN